jgi:hypothetical protein
VNKNHGSLNSKRGEELEEDKEAENLLNEEEKLIQINEDKVVVERIMEDGEEVKLLNKEEEGGKKLVNKEGEVSDKECSHSDSDFNPDIDDESLSEDSSNSTLSDDLSSEKSSKGKNKPKTVEKLQNKPFCQPSKIEIPCSRAETKKNL